MLDVMNENTVLLRVQQKGRVALGALAKHDMYCAHEEEGGRIVLEPVDVVPAAALSRIRSRLADGKSTIPHEEVKAMLGFAAEEIEAEKEALLRERGIA